MIQEIILFLIGIWIGMHITNTCEDSLKEEINIRNEFIERNI